MSEIKTDVIIPMQYKRLGGTGMRVSRICVGCMSFGDKNWRSWVLDEQQSTEIIQKAWEAGINFFDTADMYSDGESERIVGNAIRTLQIPRDEFVIASKCFMEIKKSASQRKHTGAGVTVNNVGLSRKHIFEACEASLARLQTPYIDLYQIHRWDNDTPIEETMKALHDLVQMGKVRYIGASTMYAWQFAKAQHVAKINGWTPFVSMQNLYNLVYREEEREMIPMCVDSGVGVIPWSPLARGFLAGKAESSTRSDFEKDSLKGWFNDSSYRILEVVKAIAARRQVTCAQIATAWVLSKEAITAPIVGVTKVIKNKQTNIQTKKNKKKKKHIHIPTSQKPITSTVTPFD